MEGKPPWDELAKKIGVVIEGYSSPDTLTALAAVLSALILHSYGDDCDDVVDAVAEQVRGSVHRLRSKYDGLNHGRTIQ